uniref:Glycosyltransferase family 28 C-terminal domain containing protein n=1 Tax=Arundo donax TaxID=35708 RepID=A0A0A9E8G7_ARUDO
MHSCNEELFLVSKTRFMWGMVNQSGSRCDELYQLTNLVGMQLVPSETCLPSISHHLQNEMAQEHIDLKEERRQLTGKNAFIQTNVNRSNKLNKRR